MVSRHGSSRTGSWQLFRPFAMTHSIRRPAPVQWVWMVVLNSEEQIVAKLVFFRQARIDGGVRTGVDLDETSLLHDFERGGDDDDPSLIWYIDIEFSGDDLPTRPDAARHWLLERAPQVSAALDQLADDLAAGIDFGSWPVRRTIANGFGGASATISCSAVRRIDCREIADHLIES